MTLHPKERGATRRDFLIRSGGARSGPLGRGVAARGVLELDHATGGAGAPAPAGQPVGPGGLPLARPDKRVTLPLWKDPIASGLKPETGGTFTIFNYPNYLYTKLFKEFAKKYDVDAAVHAVRQHRLRHPALASGSVQPDVMEMTPDNLDQVVAGKLIKPLNLDYIPNLKKNVWPQLVSPFYDAESRYTVPYTTYATGIFWRNDHVTEDIAVDAAAVGHLLAVRRSTAARPRCSPRTARRSRWRSCARGSPTSTPRTRSSIEPGGGRPEAALQHLQHQGRRLAVPDRSPRARRGSTRPGRATRSRPTSTTCPRARPRA